MYARTAEKANTFSSESQHMQEILRLYAFMHCSALANFLDSIRIVFELCSNIQCIGIFGSLLFYI